MGAGCARRFVEDETASLRVSDTGKGIAPEFLPHLFDRFRQADASLSRRHGGLGLGLSIARHLVELHGGTITAASEGLGRGAEFTLSLPLFQARAAGHPGATSLPPGVPSLEAVTVLLVDDDPDTREVAERILKDQGAVVIVASSGAEALSVLEVRRPDVVVSDISMPEMDGYELLRQDRGDTDPAARARPPSP